MLNVEYVNPFISAVLQAIEVTATVRPTRGAPFVRTDRLSPGEITAVIGLSGPTEGLIALSLPAHLAIRLYAQMVGEEATEVTPDVLDAMGEITNMIAGGAKAVFSQRGFTFKISIPQVLIGRGRSIPHVGDGVALVVPFQLDADTFWLEVSFDSRGAGKA